MSDDEPPNVVVFGSYDASMHPRVHILTEGLVAQGCRVTECNAPLGMKTAKRVEALQRLSTLPVFAWRLLRAWVLLLWRSRRIRRADAVLVGYLGVFDVLVARLRWPRTLIILDHLAPLAGTGEDRQLDSGPRGRLLRSLDTTAERTADLVLVDTPANQDALPTHARRRSIVVPVGASAAWFHAPKAHELPPLRVVFFGLYTPLQGTPVIAAALRSLESSGVVFEATMIGHGQELGEARAAAAGSQRITWQDWVPAAELPSTVADHHVCLGIFGVTSKASRVVPNKVFQGAAAGCAIVTSDTAPQRHLLGDAAAYVPAGDPAALTRELRILADDAATLQRMRDAAHRRAVTFFKPEMVVSPLLAAIVDATRDQPATS